MPESWYEDGLPFQCTRCGNCCTGAPGFVWVDEEEIEELARFLNEAVSRFRVFYTRPVGEQRSLRELANNDCVFYDRTQGCTVYPVRPKQCRTWPFWESNLRTPEAWERTQRTCPGAGTGELISAEEITRRLKVIKL
jgi:Fe-S-cluster containining protein